MLKDSNDVTIWTSDNLGGLNISPAFTGVPTAPTAISGTNTTQLATTAFVQLSAVAAIPVGGIILWSGSVASIPAGWLLCNGAYSTPNLADRFILGAGNLYAPAAAGGSTDAIVASHTHSIVDAGHAHQWGSAPVVSRASGSAGQYDGTGSTANNTSTVGTGITIDTAGVSPTNANMPPYYALCYIIKT